MIARKLPLEQAAGAQRAGGARGGSNLLASSGQRPGGGVDLGKGQSGQDACNC